MSPDLALLIDRWRDRTLDPADRRRLDATCADPAARAEIASDIVLQGRIDALLDARDGDAVWRAVETSLRGVRSDSGPQRIADAVGRRLADAPAPRGRPRSLTPWVLALAAGLALAIAAWMLSGTSVRAEAPVVVLAQCRDTRIDQSSADTSTATPLRAGSSLRVGAGGSALLRYDDGTTATLGPDTIATIDAGGDAQDTSRQKILRLEQGSLSAAVTRQPEGRPLRLVTPHGEAIVRGTRFMLAITAAGTRLEVEEGAVELVRDGQAVLVRGGESSLAGPGSALAVQPAATDLLRLDVEDGETPQHLREGTIVPGPPRDGNRYCIAGQKQPGHEGPANQVVIARRDQPLLTYAPGTRLSFDCWFTGELERVYLGIWHPTLRQEVRLIDEPLARGRWLRISVLLDDFRLSSDPARGFAPGDAIWDLNVATSAEADGLLYIDNLVLTQPHRAGDDAPRGP